HHHGIDSNGPNHRGERGDERRGQDRDRGNGERREFRRIHLIEKSFDIAYGDHAQYKTSGGSAENHDEDFRSYATGDVWSLSSDRHADSDFAAPLENGVVEDAVESDAREQQRDGS